MPVDEYIDSICTYLKDNSVPYQQCEYSSKFSGPDQVVHYIGIEPESPGNWSAQYSIVPWSASRDVLVLYFNVTKDVNGSQKLVTDIDEMRQLLVPSEHSQEMREAISQTEHPISGLPTFFIHPCHTSELKSSLGPDFSWPLWLQFFGSRVGLNIGDIS